MKMRLLTNSDGFVLAIGPRKVVAAGADAPARVELVPLQGQLVVDVDVSKQLADVAPSDLQRQYRFDFRRKALVKFQPRPARAAAAAPEGAPEKAATARKKRK
jgi:hypothetical protein